MADPVVEFKNVGKVYGGGVRRRVAALANVSLSLYPGEVLGVVGPNRAGKTTLVKLLLSVARPSQGEIIRFGRAAGDKSTLARVGYVHENQAFPRYLSARELLDYYGALALVGAGERQARIPALLREVGLDDRASDPISTYSKGMLQRLGLAQALLNQPDLLVLDEPSEGMDILARSMIHEAIARQRQAGRTILLVSHLIADVAKLCDRLAVLHGGKLVYSGPPDDLARANGAGDLEDALRALYGRGAA